MSAAIKHRTDARPSPADWDDGDPMTLVEFAAVFGGVYPITVSAMRTEIGRGRLTATFVGGTYYVTPSSVKALFKCLANPRGRVSTSAKGASTVAQDKRSPTGSSSETERVRSAQVAALSAWGMQSESLPLTSPTNGNGRPPKVIPLRS